MNDKFLPLEEHTQRITTDLGSVIHALYEKGKQGLPSGIHLDDLKKQISSGEESGEWILQGALSILHILGLIRVASDGLVMITSRHANFTLGSLSKFLAVAIPATYSDHAKYPTKSIVNFNKNLEAIRIKIAGVDKAPLHEREVINLIIKGQQRRTTGLEDVYLCVHREDWNQYHLVGWSREADESDQEVAENAMYEHLKIKPGNYNLSLPAGSDDATLTIVSVSNGVLTKYTFHPMIVTSLDFSDVTQDPKCQWFTWDEIRREKKLVKQGDDFIVLKIMEGTPLVMKKVGDLDSIKPVITELEVDTPDNESPLPELRGWFSRQLNRVWLMLAIFIIVYSPIIIRLVLPWLDTPNHILENLASFAQIFEILIPFSLVGLGLTFIIELKKILAEINPK